MNPMDHPKQLLRWFAECVRGWTSVEWRSCSFANPFHRDLQGIAWLSFSSGRAFLSTESFAVPLYWLHVDHHSGFSAVNAHLLLLRWSAGVWHLSGVYRMCKRRLGGFWHLRSRNRNLVCLIGSYWNILETWKHSKDSMHDLTWLSKCWHDRWRTQNIIVW